MDLAIIGEGGHSKVIKDMIRTNTNYKIKAIFDDKYEKLILLNAVYRGPVISALRLFKCMEHLKFVVAIGNNKVRKAIVEKLELADEHYVSLVHGTAVVSPSVTIGVGTIVMAHTVINADAQIGKHVIVNTGAIIEHDNRIGNYAHVAPHATLTGAVIIKEGAMIGAGATVIPGKTIGEWSSVGAGATVISDIPLKSTAVGTPARIITKPLNSYNLRRRYANNANQ